MKKTLFWKTLFLRQFLKPFFDFCLFFFFENFPIFLIFLIFIQKKKTFQKTLKTLFKNFANAFQKTFQKTSQKMLTDFLVIVVITVLIGLLLLNIWMIWFITMSDPVKKINHDFHPELNQGPADLQSVALTIIPPRVCIQINKHRPPSVYRARVREQNTTSEREIVRTIGMHQCSARAAQNTWNNMRLWGWLWWLFSLLSRSWARA